MEKKPLIIIGLVVLFGAGILIFQNSASGDKLSHEIGHAATGAAVQSVDVKVDITGYAFKDQVIKIKKGTKVTWTNRDNAPHTVTSDEGTFLDSKVLNKDQSYDKVFDQTGVFKYHCTPHPQMIAAVIVIE